MQPDWRNCKCQGKQDVPLAARGCALVEVVTPLGAETNSPDQIDWSQASKWRDAPPSPHPRASVPAALTKEGEQ